MNPHRLDPIALVAGMVTIAAGLIAAMHQGGAISLNLALVVVLGLIALGVAGAALVVLESRRRPPEQERGIGH
ncbi:MAG: hypothetical protein WBA45_12505 [Microthrixaceae bacterium]